MNINWPAESSRSCPISKRIFESACFLFSEGGFRGTDVRDICRHADVDEATLCNYFHSKARLYEAVVIEAGGQLAAAAEDISNHLGDAAPEARLRSIVESLFKRLGEDNAWIVRLVARLLADPARDRPGWAGLGFERYLLLLESEIKKLLGPEAASEVVRLHTLSVIGQCVFYCLISENLPKIFLDPPKPLPEQKVMAQHVASLLLEALQYQQKNNPFPDAIPETVSKPVGIEENWEGLDSSDSTGLQRHKRIEALAYNLYLQRGKEPGHALDDWLEAEKRIRTLIADEISYRLELGFSP